MFKKIPNHKGIYSVSLDGEVRNDRTGRILKTWTNNVGYECIKLAHPRTSYTVHRLVAGAFCNKKTHHTEVNHKDGVKINNNHTNLEWCTRSENTKHAHANGLNSGTRVVCDKSIMSMIDFGYSQKEISKHFNVSQSCITEAKKRLGMNVVPGVKLSDDQKSEAIEAVLAGIPQKYIANEYGCDSSTISRLMTSYRQAEV